MKLNIANHGSKKDLTIDQQRERTWREKEWKDFEKTHPEVIDDKYNSRQNLNKR